MVMKKMWTKPPGMLQEYWNEEIERRNDPNNAHDVEVELELIKEVNALGYNFFWAGQFDASVFSAKDKEVVPIFLKHLNRFENKKIKIHYLWCLAVKGFDDATEYLIEESKKNLPPSYDHAILNTTFQAIMKIQDLRYVDTYIDFLQDEIVVTETGYVIEMLGKMKIEKAIPFLVKFLEYENKICDSYKGCILEDCKYFVSQKAISALAQFKNSDHIKYVEKFLKPEKLSWIRFSKEAVKDYKSIYQTTYTTYRKLAEKAIKKMRS